MAVPRLALGFWLLLLLQDTQAAPQASVTSPDPCATLENWFYDETSQSCCYQCPSGSVKRKACPRDPDGDCMRCGPEEYVNTSSPKPYCDACVSCTEESDLVEMSPCSLNSSRVCQCRPGLFCQTPAQHTCTRCQQHTLCQPGFGVKVRGTSTTDVTCEKCPDGTFSDQSSSTEICKPHTNCAALHKIPLRKGNATHDQVCLDPLPTSLTPSTLSVRSSNEMSNFDLKRLEMNLVTISSTLFSATTTENPSSTPEEKALAGTFPTLAKEEMTRGGQVLWGVLLTVAVLLVSMLLFWKVKVCQKQVLSLREKSHLHSIISHKFPLSISGFDPVKRSPVSVNNTPKQITFPLQSLLLCWQVMLTTESGPEEKELIGRTLPLEANNNLVSSTEKPDVSVTDVAQSNGNAPDCLIDSRVRDHTNNRIETICIMNANTVIVGPISDGSSGKNCAARGCESHAEGHENPEEELAMHYPEQETESFPGNDVMIPVEEEGKEFHHPTTATEK
ncbi:tumor necrosis factor receptor superfamily member 8 [Heliangelus exortis]|uniref:tumor necrosis factor receptor superfamily member 8 n=1 Tax=Heliangelus exortis TaxID=472823 RepID=UPI003A8E33DE